MTGERHVEFEFSSQYLQYIQHAFSAIDCKSPQNWPTNQDSLRSKRQRFQYVCAPAYASIHIDLATPGNCIDDFGKRFDAGNSAIELSTSMI